MLLGDPGEHVGAGAGLDVEGGALVRVLAVGQLHELLVRHHPVLRERLVAGAEPARDRRVVGGRVGERLVRQPLAGLGRDLAVGLAQLLEHRVVGLGADEHRDPVVVLGRRADHRRAADVDVLDRLALAHVEPGDGLLERIEVDADQVDRLDPLGLERGHVLAVVAAREQRRVQPRVQRLHPPVEQLGGAGELGHVGDLDSRLADRRGGAAGGEDLARRARSARARSRPPRSSRRPRSAPVAPAAGSRRAGRRPPG